MDLQETALLSAIRVAEAIAPSARNLVALHAAVSRAADPDRRRAVGSRKISGWMRSVAGLDARVRGTGS